LQSRRSLIQSPGKGKSYTLNPLGLAEKVEKGIAAWLSDMERDAAKHADFCDRAARVFDPSAFVRWPLERRLSPNLCKRNDCACTFSCRRDVAPYNAITIAGNTMR